ncbi:MAG: transglycosylase SLT domain-containing protein [Acidobacteria bacterium]|nr:transglycosylase SLT domain-containing protein [Acidobacteriota bacterium]
MCPSPASAQSSAATKPGAAKKSSSPQLSGKKTVPRKKAPSPRLRRMRQAFVASADLKPMARQLLQDRTPAAYAGVEAYAHRHTLKDAGALAWLVLGYARTLDRDYPRAIDALRRAQPQAGDLGDYAAYYLAGAYVQAGQNADALALLAGFDTDYPNSLLLRDAHVLYGNVLLSAERAADAIAVLEKDRQPPRADLELALGKAYAAAGQTAKAAATYSNLYYAVPLSMEADLAAAELKKVNNGSMPAASFEQRRSRADLLLKGRRYSDAADEYRALLGDAPANERASYQLDLAEALRRAGRSKDSRQVLDSLTNLSTEQNAERLFNLGEIARAANDEDEFLKNLTQLRQLAPTSSWMEQGLLSAGNIFLLRKEYDPAIDAYRELQQRFPNGGRASYAHWKVAWLSLRQGRTAEARQGFEQQIALYPASAQVAAALYWRGRLAEEEQQPGLARAYYTKVSQRFRNYYYGDLARQRLAKLAPAEAVPVALLDRIPPISANARTTLDPVPSDNLRLQKALLLENGSLVEFAVRELQAAAQQDKGSWVPAETARLYQDAGNYAMGIETLKRAVPNYFALDISSLPRPYWEALFPKPFWADLKRFSSANALDPYLVASLIRQESEFNPNAVSRANAVGLMQLLPKVGHGVAKQEKLRHFTNQQLFVPAVNLQLGTRYFRQMVDKFGAFEYALAAYNAGSNRVDDWLGDGKYRDPQEFVESIPFTETREYVQAILRNASVYRQLYGAP